jgi:hypothetical protein
VKGYCREPDSHSQLPDPWRDHTTFCPDCCPFPTTYNYTPTRPKEDMPLPTSKTKPIAGLASRNILIFGDPKTGKTTLAAGLRPESTLFIATEDGLSGLEAYAVRVNSWEEFLITCGELANAKDESKPFDTIVIDTVDELARMCADYVVQGLGVTAGMAPGAYLHASDFDFGKGWAAQTEQFRLKLAKLCGMGMAVVFLSHTKESTVKDRTGLESTKYSPDVGTKGMRNWLLGFVDLIAYTHREMSKDGKTVLYLTRFHGDPNVESGGRVGADDWGLLPEVVPTDPESLNNTFARIWGAEPTTTKES